MTRTIAALLVAALAVTACGRIRDSKINPFNWFGGSEEEVVQVVDGVPQDPRPVVQEVTGLEVARQPGGAIVTATGVPPTQGWWDAALVPDGDGSVKDGVLTYRFVVEAPLELRRTSTPQSREVTAAVYLSDIRLQGVSKIVVLGASNSRSTSR
ncbi:MAG: hypothetical protein LCH69_10810 [Proteobacteria bacterium]|nr:hypothetical protein [Pseudomonadota bacterium]